MNKKEQSIRIEELSNKLEENLSQKTEEVIKNNWKRTKRYQELEEIRLRLSRELCDLLMLSSGQVTVH